MKKLTAMLFSVLLISATSLFAAPPADYGLLWSDEFNGTELDATAWTNNVGTGTNGWGNMEKEYYTDGANLEFGNGAVALVAKKEDMSGSGYTSARFHSQGKQRYMYGYVEVKMKAPKGQALWSAIWMLGDDFENPTPWPACGEVEIFEQRSGQQQYAGFAGDNYFIGTCHYAANGSGGAVYNSQGKGYSDCLCTDYHLYAVQWDETKFTYFFDGVKYWEYPITASFLTCFHQNMFLIFNIAIGGNYQGNIIDDAIFPQKMYVDYVRWYQKGVGVGKNIGKQATRASFSLVNPSTAQLKVFDLSGKLVADYTNKVRQMKAGDNVMKKMPTSLLSGAYVVRLTDNGTTVSQRLVSAK